MQRATLLRILAAAVVLAGCSIYATQSVSGDGMVSDAGYQSPCLGIVDARGEWLAIVDVWPNGSRVDPKDRSAVRDAQGNVLLRVGDLVRFSGSTRRSPDGVCPDDPNVTTIDTFEILARPSPSR